MYRAEDIKQALMNVVGWRQSFDTFKLTIDEALTKSETGQYFQDIHPLITLDGVQSIAPRFDAMSFTQWVKGETYKKGQIVQNNGTFRALKDTNQPTDTEDWEKVDLFSEWLREKTGASILKVIEQFYSSKLQDKTLNNLLESKVLFDGAGRLSDVVRPTNNVVGFELNPIKAEGVTMRIERVGLQFNKSGKVKLYLMHTSSSEPIKTFDLDYTKNGTIQWFDTEMFLPYMSDETDAGGNWYLCYDQKELPEGMMAINKGRDWAQAPCTCNRREYQDWQHWSKYLRVAPFRVKADDKMWDISDNVYTYSNNYGINIKFTIMCDMTDFIISHRRTFQNVIALQVAADMIREFAYNPNYRLNRQAQNFSRNELLYELDGDTQGRKGGIMWRLEQAMAALELDVRELNYICLPCNTNGIRYTTA